MKTIDTWLERHQTSRRVADLGWTAWLIYEVALAIQTEHFFLNLSWLCTECECYPDCQRWRAWEPPPASPPVAVGGKVSARSWREALMGRHLSSEATDGS